MRKLADQLRLAQELIFEIFVETMDEGLQCHSAADDVVPRPLHAARGSRTDGLQSFVAAFSQGNHLGGAQKSPCAVAQSISMAIAIAACLRRRTWDWNVPGKREKF